MSAKVVQFGSVRIKVRPWKHPSGRPYWRFRYHDKAGWRTITRAKKAEAISEALRTAKRLSGEAARWEDVPAEIRQEALQLALDGATCAELRDWRRQRARTWRTVAEMVEAFIEHRHAGRTGFSRHAADVDRSLRRLSAELGSAELRAVTREELQQWLNAIDVGPKRRKDLRSMLVQLWEWARLEGECESPTAAERLAKVSLPARDRVRIFQPAEMGVVLAQVDPTYLPWVVMAGFSGLRSEEIRAQDLRAKPPLDWSHVGQDYIEVPALISKVRRRRLVPIHKTLRAWLEVIDRPKRGPILPGSPSSWQISKLAKALDGAFDRAEGWPPNVLRHSFGSYQAASTRNIPALAIEMGNSEAIIRRHYEEATTKTAAEAYFGLLPS